ncbi:MAG TPA: tRNA (adenosine(37)-N6)-threonylcarbamoyltransferase complex dimerization subunit type 1 TsaB [Pyrinomonadaceae bacterium]|nr:tRNA (adenosine(37)-N6)-threonylcarbamoyltransferase complex dimerization subunit type 1 TsaB [Pyrinomonadaceae bacterium]
MNKQNNVILAVESAICGGSISLLKDGIEIANWIGSSNVSKAEDLLVNIDAILTSTKVSRHDIDLVAVSAGPGSFTGIRIGLATALGLKAGLGIEMASESALKAMVRDKSESNPVTAALPVGRNSVCLQTFQILDREVDSINEPYTLSDDVFFDFLRGKNNEEFVLHDSLYERCDATPLVTNFGTNLAFAIGSICSEYPGIIAAPLFVSKSV